MFKLDGAAAFVAVAEAGSISAAAARLGLAKSVVSDRLTELERSLGARLLQRTSRKLSLTEDGLAFLPRARLILNEVAEATAEAAERRGTLAGPLRICGPVSFGSLHLGPALYSLLRKHPEIELSLELEDRFVDAAADGYDAVVRHGVVRSDRLVVKRLAPSRRVLVAAPSYLETWGAPRTLEELGRHKAVQFTYRGAGDWRFKGADGAVVVHGRTALRVNHGLVMRDAAVAGLGVTLLPTFMIARELAEGALRLIDVGVEPEGAELYIAYPRDRAGSAKLKALTDHLRRCFGDPPYWDGPPA